MTRFYVVEQLGQKQALTREGFLLCKDVPIARVGTLLYGDGEIPVESNADGFIKIERRAEHVFNPDSIASFEGKPIVINHPDEDVTPETWKALAVGHIQNVRQGKGAENDLLLADLLVTDQKGIDKVRGKPNREVSCGYDADYNQISPGLGFQYNILGNHLALVTSGRCGSRCSIGDHATVTGGSKMTKKPASQRFMDAIRRAFRDGDEAAFEELLTKPNAGMKPTIGADGKETPVHMIGDEDTPGGESPDEHHVHVHMHGMNGPAGEREETEDCAMTGDEAPAMELEELAEQHGEMLELLEEICRAVCGEGAGTTDGLEEVKSKEAELQNGTKDSVGRIRAMHAMVKAHRTKDDPEHNVEPTEPEDGTLEAEAPLGATGDMMTKSRDSAFMVPSIKAVLASCEILAPGAVKVPTFDATKSTPRQAVKVICGMRRKALTAAMMDPETANVVIGVSGQSRPDFSKMTCDAARYVFNAAVAIRRHANNGGGSEVTRRSNGAVKVGPRSVAELNKANAEHYAKLNG